MHAPLPAGLQEHSPDSRHREDSAALLDCLISSAPRLILPYVSPINKSLVAKLKVNILSSLSDDCLMPDDAAVTSVYFCGDNAGCVACHAGACIYPGPGWGPCTHVTSCYNDRRDECVCQGWQQGGLQH
jgi:hypothetical protein